MPIEIYPNRLEARPIETHQVNTRMSIAAFLDQTMTGGYRVGDSLALSAWVNDELVPQEQWGEFIFLPKDHVRLHIEPRGTDPFSITVALFAGVKAVFGMLMPKLPGTPNSPGQGDSLNQNSVRGNKIKLGDPVREIAGRMKVYPDYLVPPRKYFQNYREQWTELGLCVGVGSMQILADNVKIGDTSLLALGPDATYQVFGPDEQVSGYSAFDWWHTAPEVGASSTGAAGLELTASSAVTPSPTATQFRFSGYSINVVGSGQFPNDWAVGLILRIVAPYSYTVTDGAAGARDVISGPLAMLNPSVGDAIEVVGVNGGKYTVASYNPAVPEMTLNFPNGTPANQLALGTGSAAIGPDGLRFRITSKTSTSITVERLDYSGSADPDFPGFDTGTLAGASVQIDASNYESGWRGPFPACPENEVTDRVELDFFYPNGLCGVGQEGNIYELGVQYEVQWRVIGTSAWSSAAYRDGNSTLDQGGYTKTIALAPDRYEFRVRKTFPLFENLELHDTVQWYAMRARIPYAPAAYTGCTTIGLKVRSSDRISAQTESLISVIATRILPTVQGGTGPTRNLADFAMYIPQSLGYPLSRVNMDELRRLDAIWRSRGDNFDMSYDKETTAQQALQDVFAVGFAELTIERGQITPVRDEPRTTYEQMYTPQNMVGYLRRTPRILANPEEFDGVDVTYTDARTWSESTVSCRLPGDQGLRVEKVTMPGVTDRTKAYQLGMRRRRVQRYRPDSFSWRTEADALVSRYLSFCAVADDVTGYPQSALLMSFVLTNDGNMLLRVSEPFEWGDTGSHGVLLRRPDGSVAGTYPATRVSDYELLIPAADFVPDVSWEIDPPHVLFGSLDRMCYPVLITSVRPNGMSSAEVEAVGYDARVYLDDDSPLP
jgi:hypothetical protein